MSKPKFEVGKTYKNRQGDSVRITHFEKGISYPYLGEKDGDVYGETFSAVGEYLIGEQDQRDLVHSEVQTYTKTQIESAIAKLGASPTEFFAVVDAQRLEYLRLKAIYGESP